MARWTDKSGLKTDVTEPDIVEHTIDEMNRLAAAERQMRDPNNLQWAQKEQRRRSHDLIVQQNVIPYKERGVWKVLPPPDVLLENLRKRS